MNELTVLALAALLQMLQFVLMAVPVNRELGAAKTMSPRDPERVGGSLSEQVSPGVGRLIRALNNHFEALILFTVAVLAVHLSGAGNALTLACAWIYLVARVLYVPAYYFGWVPWRSVIWGLGWVATGTMLLVAVLHGIG